MNKGAYGLPWSRGRGFQYVPAAKVTAGYTQSVAANSDYLVVHDTVLFDEDNMWSPFATDRLTVQTPGVYRVYGYLRNNTGSDVNNPQHYTFLSHGDGERVIAYTSCHPLFAGTRMSIVGQCFAEKNDYFQLRFVFGGSGSTSWTFSASLAAVWTGPKPFGSVVS